MYRESPPDPIAELACAKALVSVSVAFTHSLSAIWATAKYLPNYWFPVSIPPLPLFIWQIALTFTPLSPPVPSTSVSVSTSSCPPSSTSFQWVSLLFMSLRPSLLNWNSSLWNGNLIYFDSSGFWLVVLSGTLCNVTGNVAVVNILPPGLKSQSGPTSNILQESEKGQSLLWDHFWVL